MSQVERPPPQWGVRGVIPQPLAPISCCLSLSRDNLSAPPSALYVDSRGLGGPLHWHPWGAGDTGPEGAGYKNLLLHATTLQGVAESMDAGAR